MRRLAWFIAKMGHNSRILIGGPQAIGFLSDNKCNHYGTFGVIAWKV